MGDRMLTDLKVETLLERVGSKEPVPGGGSCSALAGALAASLVQMVAYLSGEEHGDVIDQAQVLVDRLSHLAERDTEAFQAVMVAYKLPKQGEEGKRFRRVAIQSGLKMATEVPLQVMNVATDVLVLAKKMAVHGNANAISDAGVAGLFAAAACRGAAYNVLINLPGLTDPEFVSEARGRVEEILVEADRLEQEIRQNVTQVLIGALDRR